MSTAAAIVFALLVIEIVLLLSLQLKAWRWQRELRLAETRSQLAALEQLTAALEARTVQRITCYFENRYTMASGWETQSDSAVALLTDGSTLFFKTTPWNLNELVKPHQVEMVQRERLSPLETQLRLFTWVAAIVTTLVLLLALH